MKFLPILALVATLLFSALAAIDVEEGVLVLTDDNFDEAIGQYSHILVEFYAPWCGHCKNLAPEYSKAAETLKDDIAKLAKLDATANEKMAKKFEIKGFPTLKFFRNGKPSEYQGGRTASEIANWMKKKSGPVAATINTEEDLLKLQEANEVVVVGVFSSQDPAPAKAFLDAAAEDDSLVYAISTSAAVRSKLAVSGDSIVLFKTFDELRADLPVAASTSSSDIISWAAGKSVPLVQTFTQESAQKIFKSSIQIHSLFFTDTKADHHESTMALFKELAAEYVGKTLMVNVPSTESRVMEYFGLEAKDLPALMIADMSSAKGGPMRKFKYDGIVNKEGVGAFIANFFAGTLKPTLKSEQVDEIADFKDPVKVLKGANFNEKVLAANNQDVLVEFYAPWCGHCKKLAPIYDELAAKLKDNQNIMIAKIDATANDVDVPGVEVSGFPTLYFFPGNDKSSPKRYEGGRDLDGFMTYLKENAHHKASISHEEL